MALRSFDASFLSLVAIEIKVATLQHVSNSTEHEPRASVNLKNACVEEGMAEVRSELLKSWKSGADRLREVSMRIPEFFRRAILAPDVLSR